MNRSNPSPDTSSAPEVVTPRPDFVIFALPTFGVSMIVAIFLVAWPQWSLQIIASQAMKGNLVWIVSGLALLISTAAYVPSLGAQERSFAGMWEHIAAVICAAVTSAGLFLLSAEPASPQSGTFWQLPSPREWHRAAVDMVAASYFGLIGGVFAVPCALAVLRGIAERFFAPADEVERRPA